jgi:GAF domain-containing protein
MGNPPEEKTSLTGRGRARPYPRPEVPEEKLAESERLGVPVGLIKRAEFERTVVLVANDSDDHPFARGQSTRLDSGVYCETVAARRQELMVPNALLDPEWSDGPSVQLGFVSYLGYPLLWPDGEIFGTLCVLDRKEHDFSEDAQTLMAGIRADIEQDLAALIRP